MTDDDRRLLLSLHQSLLDQFEIENQTDTPLTNSQCMKMTLYLQWFDIFLKSFPSPFVKFPEVSMPSFNTSASKCNQYALLEELTNKIRTQLDLYHGKGLKSINVRFPESNKSQERIWYLCIDAIVENDHGKVIALLILKNGRCNGVLQEDGEERIPKLEKFREHLVRQFHPHTLIFILP